MSADVGSAQRSAHGFSHRHERLLARRRRVIAHVKLDSIRDFNTAPAQYLMVIASHRLGGACAQCGSQRSGDPPLEEIASDVAHLRLDRLERLALALPDLYREELKEVPITVGSSGPGAFGPVEQAMRDVESNGARARRSARR